MKINVIICALLFLLPSCHSIVKTVKTETNRHSIPDMKYFVDKTGDGSFEKVDLEEKPQPGQGKDQWTRDFYGAIKYPPSARSRSIQGIVMLTVAIDKLGTVQEVTVAKSLSGDCDAAAKAAFLQSTKQGYTPLIIEDNAVDFKVDVPVGFWLE